MRRFIIFSILAGMVLSASLNMTHSFAMHEADGMGCEASFGCVESTGSPVVDCVQHCLNQQVPLELATPIFLDWSVLLLFFAIILSSFPNIARDDVFRSGRDAPFGRRSLLLQLRTVEIKS